MVFASKSGFESQLCKGKVLAPLTFFVLNRNHLLVLLVYGCCYLKVTCYRLMGEMRREKKI